MKNKFSKILGVALTLALLASMMVASVPASGRPLGFTAEKYPVDQVENTVVPATDITDLAANGDVVYAATNNAALPLYKSTDGGATWASLKNTTAFPATSSIKYIAVAADDANTVVFVSTNASGDKVYYSSNGGSSWTNLNNPTNSLAANVTINSIDVSTGSTRYIAAGGALAGAAKMYTIRLAMAESWTERYTGAAGAVAGETNMVAIKFSPNFATEKAIVTVTGNGTTAARLQIFRYEGGDYEWNGAIDYLNATDWANGVLVANAITGGLVTADIALPASFMANSEGDRLAYVSVAGAAVGGVYRVTDIVVKAFETWSGGDEGPIGSIAYSEDGKIIGGSWSDSKVYQWLSPTDTAPKASRPNTYKQPGGQNKVSVVLVGSKVLAGTQGANSGISVSTDDGYSFNDTGLIDVALTVMSDVAVNADGSKVYLVTDDTVDTSVWMKSGSANWQRVLVITGVTGMIIRIAPDNDKVVYLADVGTTNIWSSSNSGTESWKSIPCYKATGNIVDMVVESADVAYVLNGAGGSAVSKTTNGGSSWGELKKSTEDVGAPTMIALAPNGDVLVGGTGYVAFSKDGGATFSRTQVVSAGNAIYVAADDGYTTNNIIYVGSNVSVFRGKADTTTTWGGAKGAVIAGPVSGIQQVGGTTYVMASPAAAASVLYKSSKLETATDNGTGEWSRIASGAAVRFLSAPQSVKASVSGTTPKFWAIDTAGVRLHSLTDPVAIAGPTAKSPAEGTNVAVNSETGIAFDVTFIFDRPVAEVTQMELEIALDKDFSAIVAQTGALAVNTASPAWIIGPNGATLAVTYMPGQTYYWRVRASAPWIGPWSTVRSFKVAALDKFIIGGPALGALGAPVAPTFTWAPYPEAIGYEIMLSEDPTFAIIEWSYNVPNNFYVSEEPLKYSTTYYWRVRGVTGASVLVGSAWQTPAGPWITGVFTTMSEAAAEAAEGTPTQTTPVVTPPAVTEVKVVEVPVTTAPVIPTYILWVIVGIGAILIIALIVLIVRTRRVA